MNPFLRLWRNAAWELRFPLFIRNDDHSQAILRPHPLRIAQRVLALVLRKTLAKGGTKHAVLTFDDGPYTGSTEALLAALAKETVPATFFLVGDDAQRHRASTQAIVAAGMEIASHSKSHRRLTEITREEQLDEIMQGKQLVEAAAGVPVRYFRPPHGAFDATTLEQARVSGQELSLWNVNPADYDDVDAAEIVARTIDQERSPAVILLHSGRPETIAALPEIVRHYRERGYTFTTVGALAANA